MSRSLVSLNSQNTHESRKLDAMGLLNSCGSTWIPAWISIHIPNELWGEITYPFLNLNGETIEAWEWISNPIPHLILDVITYPFRVLKLIHINKRGHSWQLNPRIVQIYYVVETMSDQRNYVRKNASIFAVGTGQWMTIPQTLCAKISASTVPVPMTRSISFLLMPWLLLLPGYQ